MDIHFTGTDNFKIKSRLSTITTSPMAVGDKIIYGPGEYEIAGVSVRAFRTKEKNNIFLIESDKLNLLFLGDFDGKLEADLIDELGDVDIILTTKGSAINEGLRLDPYFVITTDPEAVKDLGYVLEQTSKFTIKKEDILENQSTKIVVLTSK